jgi:hypothetical protein
LQKCYLTDITKLHHQLVRGRVFCQNVLTDVCRQMMLCQGERAVFIVYSSDLINGTDWKLSVTFQHYLGLYLPMLCWTLSIFCGVSDTHDISGGGGCRKSSTVATYLYCRTLVESRYHHCTRVEGSTQGFKNCYPEHFLQNLYLKISRPFEENHSPILQ